MAVACWRCADDQPRGLVCARCGAVQRLAEPVDYFAVLGLPSHPAIEVAELERRYYELSRQIHPDRFQTDSPDAQQASLRATAVLNAAFRTLRDVESRGRYWLESQGEHLNENNNRVPSGLAAYVFEVQEKLSDLTPARNGARQLLIEELAETAEDLRLRRERERAALESLLRSWPETPNDVRGEAALAEVRGQLKRLLSELSYLRTLWRDVQGALEPRGQEASPAPLLEQGAAAERQPAQGVPRSDADQAQTPRR